MTVKRDLNLLPKRDRSPAFRRVGLPFIITGAALAVMLVMGTLIPNGILGFRLVQKALLEKQISGQADVETKYAQIMDELASVQNKLLSAEAFASEGHGASELFAFFEEKAPPDVLLTAADFDIAGVSLTGQAPTDTAVAQFAINLRDSGRFASVSIVSVQPLEGLSSAVNTSPRLFALRLDHPVTEAKTDEKEAAEKK